MTQQQITALNIELVQLAERHGVKDFVYTFWHETNKMMVIRDETDENVLMTAVKDETVDFVTALGKEFGNPHYKGRDIIRRKQ